MLKVSKIRMALPSSLDFIDSLRPMAPAPAPASAATPTAARCTGGSASARAPSSTQLRKLASCGAAPSVSQGLKPKKSHPPGRGRTFQSLKLTTLGKFRFFKLKRCASGRFDPRLVMFSNKHNDHPRSPPVEAASAQLGQSQALHHWLRPVVVPSRLKTETGKTEEYHWQPGGQKNVFNVFFHNSQVLKIQKPHRPTGWEERKKQKTILNPPFRTSVTFDFMARLWSFDPSHAKTTTPIQRHPKVFKASDRKDPSSRRDGSSLHTCKSYKLS